MAPMLVTCAKYTGVSRAGQQRSHATHIHAHLHTTPQVSGCAFASHTAYNLTCYPHVACNYCAAVASNVAGVDGGPQ